MKQLSNKIIKKLHIDHVCRYFQQNFVTYLYDHLIIANNNLHKLIISMEHSYN